MSTSTRRTCAFCSEELAPTAYFRHLHDRSGTVCPGKRRRCNVEVDVSEDDLSHDDLSQHVKLPRALDSTFELTSDEESLNDACEQVPSHTTVEGDDTFKNKSDEESLESSSESTLSEEVWEISEDEETASEPSTSTTVAKVVSGISFFLVFFHLVCRLSERAANTLLGFIRAMIRFFGIITQQHVFDEIIRALPKSVHTIRGAYKQNGYVEYVVCPKCCHLYNQSECIIERHNQMESKWCTYVEFPNHPHPNRRNPCNDILMKRVKVGSRCKLVPRKVYTCRSLLTSLKDLARRKDFLQKCDSWRTREIGEGNIMGDVYDGKLWRDLQFIEGRPFLSNSNNLCLSLNVDWFNPFEETPYSVGAIYVVILNLPRSDRFKEENVILVGMIPGPNEPKQNINNFLAPLVQDLPVLYEGIHFENPSTTLGYSTLRAVLAIVACDLPATRKVYGFSSFNATFGCSKCMKRFSTPSFGAKPLYGGFDCDEWTPCNASCHRQQALKYRSACSTSERVSVQRQTGVKYSELLLIPHLDIIRSHVIDPMHCIFLGLAKHTVQTWKDKGILQPKDFNIMQEKVNMVLPPSKIGRIPRKIECAFSSFTADEWKNWILIYSIFALYGVIDTEHFHCWCLFVESCFFFVSTTYLNVAH